VRGRGRSELITDQWITSTTLAGQCFDNALAESVNGILVADRDRIRIVRKPVLGGLINEYAHAA
jgi:hypothetical protein